MEEKRRKEIKTWGSFPRCLAILSKNFATTTPIMWQACPMVVQPCAAAWPSRVQHRFCAGGEMNKTVPASQPGEQTHDKPACWKRIAYVIPIRWALLPVSNSFYQNLASFLYCYSSCPLLPLLSSLLNDLCFVHNSMWLSLIPGSNVPAWVSLTVSERKKDAWQLSGEIFAMLLRAGFSFWPRALVWLPL